MANKSLARLRYKVLALNAVCDARKLQASINSFLGVLSHYKSFWLRKLMFGNLGNLNSIGRFNSDWLLFRPFKSRLSH